MNTDKTTPYYPAENPAAVEGLTMEEVMRIYAEWKPAREGNTTLEQALTVQNYLIYCTGWAFYILTFELMYDGSIICVNPADVEGFDPRFPLQYNCAAKSVPNAPESGAMIQAGYFLTTLKNRVAEPLAKVTADILGGNYGFIYPIPVGPETLVEANSLWFSGNLSKAMKSAKLQVAAY